MKAVKWYDLGAFHMSLCITLGKDAYLKEYSRLTGNETDESASFDEAYAFVCDLVKPDGHHVNIVYFNPKMFEVELPENLAGICAHEAMHVVQHKWRRWGEDHPGMEAEAHLLQFITTKLYRFLKKRKDKHGGQVQSNSG